MLEEFFESSINTIRNIDFSFCSLNYEKVIGICNAIKSQSYLETLFSFDNINFYGNIDIK